ncbi:hypothetical protein FISHEDRAFT_71650 [Fistulina hepatica ATCC 64428]|uniref:Fungal N-terminal domain-containing protein n=1 Tax=Fistulina hepatica ATCC 64428 TaxID=1128425 RepID=A0A0D7AGQ2_9AGAR|nr:hypothetical protein FISHEDRAFT_71650 [Fistulina hepatica ATCC 64428]
MFLRIYDYGQFWQLYPHTIDAARNFSGGAGLEYTTCTSIVKFLIQSKGASLEYQEAILQIDSLCKVLIEVRAFVCRQQLSLDRRFVFFGPGRASGDEQPPQHLSLLSQSVQRCDAILKEFNQKIEGYGRTLAQKGGSKNRTSHLWRTIGCNLFKNDDLVEIGRQLAEQESYMVMCIGLENRSRLDDIDTSVFEVWQREGWGSPFLISPL